MVFLTFYQISQMENICLSAYMSRYAYRITWFWWFLYIFSIFQQLDQPIGFSFLSKDIHKLLVCKAEAVKANIQLVRRDRCICRKNKLKGCSNAKAIDGHAAGQYRGQLYSGIMISTIDKDSKYSHSSVTFVILCHLLYTK